MTSTAVLAASGALGFVIVAFGFPEWQVAVESAQAIAGIVEYPPDNPFYVYHVKLWTVLHQVTALMLRAGVSEIGASRLLTGVQGMLTFQALAMFVYALSRDAALALVSPLVLIVSGTANVGVTYPIFLLGTVHTYGAVGLSLVVLVAALLGCGHYRLGLFLAGLAPAVHPALGVWLALALGVALAFDVRGARRIGVVGWRSFAAGGGVSVVSLGVHLFLARGIPEVPADVASRYLDAFTSLWDEHRQPVRLDHMGVRINLAALLLAAAWLRGVRPGSDPGQTGVRPVAGGTPAAVRRHAAPAPAAVHRQKPPLDSELDGGAQIERASTTSVCPRSGPSLTPVGVRFDPGLTPDDVDGGSEEGRSEGVLLRVIAVVAASSLGFACLSWIPPERLPDWLTILMPTRLLNVAAMTFAALVLALSGSIHRRWGRWMTVALALLLVVGRRSLLWEWLAERGWLDAHPRIDPAGVLGIATIALVAAALTRRVRSHEPLQHPPGSTAALLLIAAATVWIGAAPVLAAKSRDAVYRDYTNEPVFQAASRGRGLLLTGGDMYLIQMRARRPILLNTGALDGLPYAPESGPAMARILRDVYGIDLFSPPPGTPRLAVVPGAYTRDLWRVYPPARWQQIKRAYNVTQVLAPADWQLQLPIAARSPHYVLYDIP